VRVRNIEEWIEEAHRRSMMVEKGIYEIALMGRLRKQNEDGMNSRKVEARIGGRSRKMGDGIVECRRRSKHVSQKVGKIAKGR
jgi:hypothetical protein